MACSASEPKINAGMPSLVGVAPEQKGGKSGGYPLLFLCSDADPKHEKDNIDNILVRLNDHKDPPNGIAHHRFSPPLHLALGRAGSAAFAAIILDAGGDPNLLDLRCTGLRPLHVAVCTAKLELVALLLERGADVALCDKYGSSPLHSACALGNAEIVTALLDAGADIDAPIARTADTPLHVAVRRGHQPLVALLLKNGANQEPEMTLIGRGVRREPGEHGEELEIETPSVTNLTPAMLAFSMGLPNIGKLFPPVVGA